MPRQPVRDTAIRGIPPVKWSTDRHAKTFSLSEVKLRGCVLTACERANERVLADQTPLVLRQLIRTMLRSLRRLWREVDKLPPEPLLRDLALAAHIFRRRGGEHAEHWAEQGERLATALAQLPAFVAQMELRSAAVKQGSPKGGRFVSHFLKELSIGLEQATGRSVVADRKRLSKFLTLADDALKNDLKNVGRVPNLDTLVIRLFRQPRLGARKLNRAKRAKSG